MRARALLSLVFALTSASAASAAGHDFRLNAVDANGDGILFLPLPGGGGYAPLEDRWRDLATELGYVFSPRMVSPAETLGYAGFHAGISWSGTFVSEAPFWRVTENAVREGPGPSALQTLQLDVRKGLPLSFELGLNMLWLVNSELFAPGLEVRWAIHEGADVAPDLSLRGAVNHMLGSRDMLLTTVGLDVGLSKDYGLFGMLNVTPYASWTFLLIAATSRVIDPTPLNESDLQNNFVFPEIGAGSRLHHKLTFGARLLVYVLNVSVQGELQMFSEKQTFGPVGTVTTKLGLDF